jgi:hypothetical protein
VRQLYQCLFTGGLHRQWDTGTTASDAYVAHFDPSHTSKRAVGEPVVVHLQ